MASVFNQTKKIDSLLFQKSFVFPAKAAKVEIQNTGATVVRISFDTDTKNNFYTLFPGQKTPTLDVQGDKTNLKYISLSELGRIELLMWG
jgi:hypothetical protein